VFFIIHTGTNKMTVNHIAPLVFLSWALVFVILSVKATSARNTLEYSVFTGFGLAMAIATLILAVFGGK